jgi:signal transduction histidine kinase
VNAAMQPPEIPLVRCDAALLSEVLTRLVDNAIRFTPKSAPVEQADNSSTRRYQGAGLGLAICRAVCGVMQCQIEVESHPGRGSTFQILIPTGVA